MRKLAVLSYVGRWGVVTGHTCRRLCAGECFDDATCVRDSPEGMRKARSCFGKMSKDLRKFKALLQGVISKGSYHVQLMKEIDTYVINGQEGLFTQ